jgi:23S rRNA (pseudouridine1915-N3)-methyltransferase
VKCTVLAVGRLRPPYADDVQHYRQLLTRQTRLELVEVREDEQLERRIPERCYLVELHSEGRQLDSIAFSAWLEERRQGGLDVVFTIGGPYGTPLERTPDLRLSLGPMTMPHQLARVVLLEQLYRAHKIIANEPYHH